MMSEMLSSLYVSIPYGAIKRRISFSALSRGMSVSIPYGAIKSALNYERR